MASVSTDLLLNIEATSRDYLYSSSYSPCLSHLGYLYSIRLMYDENPFRMSMRPPPLRDAVEVVEMELTPPPKRAEDVPRLRREEKESTNRYAPLSPKPQRTAPVLTPSPVSPNMDSPPPAARLEAHQPPIDDLTHPHPLEAKLTIGALEILAKQQQVAYQHRLHHIATQELRLHHWEQQLQQREDDVRRREEALHMKEEALRRTVAPSNGIDMSFSERMGIARLTHQYLQ